MNVRHAEAADASAIIDCDEYTKTDPSRPTKIGAAIARSKCLVAVQGEAVIGALDGLDDGDPEVFYRATKP